MEPAEQPLSHRMSSGVWYGIAFCVVEFGLLFLCLFISSTPWFLQHDDYPMLQSTLGYSLRAKNVNCDILLYGDSTPLTGLDPAIFEAKTGLKACNISEFRSVHWMVTSYFPIDQYLLHNSKPKYIVSNWAPFELHPETKPFVDYQAEGYVYAMEYERGSALWKGLVTHPLWTVNFSIWTGNRMINDVLARFESDHDRRWAVEKVPRDARLGLWQDGAPPQTHCGDPMKLHPIPRDEAKANIAEFKEHYERQGIHVIVDVSPIADCVPNREELIAKSSGLGADNTIQFLPTRFFNTQDVHMVPEGSKFLSNEEADQLVAIMAQDDKARHVEAAKTPGDVQSQ